MKLFVRLLFLLALAPAAGLALPKIENGSFESGAELVEGWTEIKADEGALKAVRDTDDKIEGEASLRLESVGGPAKGGVSQRLKLTPGETFTITGQAKSDAGISFASLALICPDSRKNWTELAKLSGFPEWTKFTATITVPNDAAFGLLMVFVTGEGTVRLDDLRVAAVAKQPVGGGDPADPVLTTFEVPFLFSYLGFDKKVTHEAGQVSINAKDGKGGAGMNLSRDLSALVDYSPAVSVMLGEDNRAREIKLKLIDANERELNFAYDLGAANANEFRTLVPIGAVSMVAEGFDPAKVVGLHIQGDWRAEAVSLRLDEIKLVPPTPEMLSARAAAAEEAAKRAEWQRREEERKAAAREELLTNGDEHPADGPEIVHVGAAGADLIGIEIQAGRIEPAKPVPYEKREGDEIRASDHEVLAWLDGNPALVPDGQELFRDTNGDGRPEKIGELNLSAGTVWAEKMEGLPLELGVVDEPRAYRVLIDGGEPLTPVAVWRKSKPNRIAQKTDRFSGQHFIYLKLPEPLRERARYEIQFFALNTREAAVEWIFDSKLARSEVIHISHLGYRKDDPFKRAYLSLWAGTGGGQSFDASTFHLLDENGETHFSGKVTLGLPADQAEPFINARNHTGADVYHLDFSDFDASGTYRVQVPGLGVSYPFVIGDRAWEAAFKVSMHGFLSHRSGIELGPPFTDYVRPRAMHPADGTVVQQVDVNFWDGESDAIHQAMMRALGPGLDPSKLETLPDAWGGYMDAGDWDRRSQHLMASLRHLELIELFPEKIGAIRLALPPAEAENDIPDLLDEALWNIDFFRRLQDREGGIRSGIESTAHPRPGETSWQETLLVGAYRADPESSYRYAAAGAKAARLLGDHERAGSLRDSALRAWDWAEQHADAEIDAAAARKAPAGRDAARRVGDLKALAAVELWRATGDVRFEGAAGATDPKTLEDADIAMAFALLPDTDTRLAALKAAAIESITRAADAALDFSEQNGFNLAPGSRYLPMMGFTCLWSVPGATTPPVLPRAHFLTGEVRYLAGTLASCHYSGGANPMNMTYTTGIGARYPRAPLHLDSWRSGQQPPAGITVYGQSDSSMGYAFDEFAHTWYLNRFGGVNSKEWPTAEAYVDLVSWPAMNEYTIHQTFSPTSYTWGYLAGRE